MRGDRDRECSVRPRKHRRDRTITIRTNRDDQVDGHTSGACGETQLRAGMENNRMGICDGTNGAGPGANAEPGVAVADKRMFLCHPRAQESEGGD